MTENERTGTEMERQLRRRYWALMIGGFAVALVIGLAGRASRGPEGTLAPMLAIALVAGVVLLVVGGNWVYYRSVDELEWANNLAGCFWGFNAFMLGYPAWHILWMGGLLAKPDMTALYVGAASVALAAYLWKRFR